MKTLQILCEATKIVEGTNCANCKFSSDKRESVEKSELDPQGGLLIEDKANLERARKGDLVTLPGKFTANEKFECTHPKIKQDVTEHMCCLYWDNEGCIRAFGKKAI